MDNVVCSRPTVFLLPSTDIEEQTERERWHEKELPLRREQ